MRFEAKHNYFKRMVDTINNFKNIDLSLARCHQALQAYLLQQTGRSFCSVSLELGPGIMNNKYYNYIIYITCTCLYIYIYIIYQRMYVTEGSQIGVW